MSTPIRGLGRLVEHDPRSKDYTFRVAASRPRTVLWEHTAPVLDQGQVGSCTGNALTQWLNTAFAQAKRPGVLDESKAVELYARATRLDSLAGAYPPDDTGSSGLAVCKAGKQLGYLSAYHHAFGFDALVLALQHSPVIAGTVWTEAMMQPDEAGFIRPTGQVAGGHEYLIIGADIEHQFITMLNSWSAAWGENGRAYITFADYRALLADQGDVTVPVI